MIWKATIIFYGSDAPPIEFSFDNFDDLQKELYPGGTENRHDWTTVPTIVIVPQRRDTP